MDTYVRKSVSVEVPQDRAFAFFTERHADWWPIEGHRIHEGSTHAVLEPREGGRWYEAGAPEGECDWGRVLAYEPPQRLVLGWQLDEHWRYDPDVLTEVELRFVAKSPGRTRVELEHRGLDRYPPEVRASFDGENGWSAVLGAYAEGAASRTG